jgi:hypothetical protein
MKNTRKTQIQEKTQTPQHNQPTKPRDYYIISGALLPFPG